jgi:hypothetical protein
MSSSDSRGLSSEYLIRSFLYGFGIFKRSLMPRFSASVKCSRMAIFNSVSAFVNDSSSLGGRHPLADFAYVLIGGQGPTGKLSASLYTLE